MSSTLRISRSLIAALITICVCFTCLPFSRTVNADDGANYYACKENPDAEAVTVYRGADASVIPGEAHCFAVLVNNRSQTYYVEDFIKASYQDDDPDNNIPVIANQSNIAAEGLFDLRFTLLGNSYVRWNNSNGYVTNNNYRYTGDPYDFSGIKSHITGLGDAIEKTYSFRVGASTTINDPMDLDYILAAGSAKLTIDHSGSEGRTEITVNKLELLNQSQVIIAGGNEPNGLNIKKELIARDGSITGAEGSILRFASGASLTGGLTLYASDGTTPISETDGFANNMFVAETSFTYRTSGYETARWVANGQPQDPPGIYVDFNEDLFSSCTYQFANGEVNNVPSDGKIFPFNADSVTFTFVPKAGNASVKQGDQILTVTNNSFTINKSEFDWTQDPCYVEVTAVRESGIYFHYEDGLVTEINYELGESNYGQVSGTFLPLSAYENASGIVFHVVTSNETEPIATYVLTDGGVSYGTGSFGREFNFMRSGNSWPSVYDVYIRRGEKKYPGMYLNFDRGENSPIEKIEYSIDDGALTELTDEFLSYDLYNTKRKVKFVITPKEGIDDIDLKIDWDQYYIGETVSYNGFTFENNELVLIKPENEPEWGVIYDIGIEVPVKELAKYKGYQVRLDGYIGVSYYVAIDQSIRNSDTKVTFTLDSAVPELAKQEISFDQARHLEPYGSEDYYVFDIKVVPSEMTKTITATLTNNDYTQTFDTFTVRDCVEVYTDSSKYTVQLVYLAKAIKSYGYYAQIKFGSTDPIFPEDALETVEPEADKITVGAIQDGISYSGSAVVFLSGNKLKHYFTIESNPELYTFKINGQDVQKVSAGNNLYSISSGELAVGNLNEGLKVEIFYNGTMIKTFTYSPMNYAKAICLSSSSNAPMKQLAEAFGMYYQKAIAYNNFVHH